MANPSYINADGVTVSLTSTATSQLQTIYAATGANQTLHGNSGDDEFVIFDPTDQVVVPATHGVYTIADSAWYGTYNLPTGINNLIANGDEQLVYGNAQANLIETGSYRVTVSGGGGDDVFVLGTGSDIIVDPQGSGSDVIYGFNTAIDHVRLDGSTKFTTWSSVQSALTQSGADAVLNMGNGQTLTFRNMTVGAFTSSDFYLPINTAAMTETFDDEFTSFVSSANGSSGWMTAWPYGGVSNRQSLGGQDEAYYGDSTTKVNPFKDVNGVLDITATVAAAGSNPDNLPYNTGVITTYKSFSQLYGYFEIRAQLPTGQGLWPAFYMESYDDSAELDIFEILGRSATQLFPTATDHATGDSTTQEIIIPNSSTAFHTYGVDWEANTVTFYMDGNFIASASTPASMHVPMYMIAGLGVGAPGSWAGVPTSNSIFPATYQIDYVRAYATAATLDVGGTAAISLPITVTPVTHAVTSANDAGVKPFVGVAITDKNASQTETATVTLSAANGVLSDPNAATDGSKIANGVLTVSGSAAAVATALDGLLFTPKAGQTVASVTTTVTATIKDTAGKTATTTSTITATAPTTTTPPPTPDTLALQVSEDPFGGTDAQFTVSVNGNQVGGVYTASALNSSGYDNTVLLTGDWNSGVNSVAVSYVNAVAGRNLYVDSIAYDGVTYAGTTELQTDSTKAFTVGGATPTATAPVDTITLSLSEEALNGINALFQLYIDGVAVTTPQSVTALYANNATQSFTYTGDLGTGTHTIGVGFLNDGYGGSPSLDRNLYINGITLDGTTVFSGVKEQGSVGVSTWTASEPSSPPPTPDTLALQVSEDAGSADAQFTVSVNGTQVGGVYTASALHSSGDANTILLTGDWNSGANNVAISFINSDAAGNLYVNSMAYDGTTYAGTTAALLTNSTDTFTVGGATQTASAPADSLTLSLSEEAYDGNALFQLYVDGKVASTPQMVSALHANNATQSFSFTGNFGAGTHTIGVGFVNDGYGGSPSLDRNLYINGIKLNGATVFSGVQEQGMVGVSTWTVTTTH